MDDLMSIGEFSEKSGLSPKRLRSYAAAGLLTPAAIDSSSGYRYYSPGQVRDAQLIDALRSAGVPVADLGSLLGDYSIGRLDDWARRVEADAAQRHEALDRARRIIGVDSTFDQTTTREPSKENVMHALHTVARTDIGLVRENNQDAALCMNHLVAIADGMGGSPGGEVASNLALSILEAAFAGASLPELEAAVRAASRAIVDRSATDEDLEAMGTTLCAIGTTSDGRLAVVNVGDSRVYLLRDGCLQQLTVDHSWTAELLRRGELTKQEAAAHPQRAVLTRALGVGPTVQVDGALHTAAPGDRYLLCTDGLYTEVAEDEILASMEATRDLGTVADDLIARARSNGAHDNVGVVVASIGSSLPNHVVTRAPAQRFDPSRSARYRWLAARDSGSLSASTRVSASLALRTSRGRSPQAGGMPRSTSGIENRVPAVAMRRSHAAASTRPPPTQ